VVRNFCCNYSACMRKTTK